MPSERLQKIIAAAGIASRRKAEELITAGRVSVNGQTVTELGSKADTETDDIRVDGKPLRAEQTVYVVLHKPKGYVTTASDPEGRPTVLDLVKGVPQRVFPVGRLDYLSEGLLLLTNDGELAAKLTHASTHVPKRYHVKVSGQPAEEDIQKLREGVVLPPEHGHVHAPAEEGGKFGGQKRRSTAVSTAPAKIELIREGDNPWYEVTLVEGRNRQIRRMFSFIGHHVEKIKRMAYGPLELDTEPGQWRSLTPAEVAKLQTASTGRHPAPSGEAKRIAPAKNRKEFAAGRRDERRGYEGKRPERRTFDRKERPAFPRQERGSFRRNEGESAERGRRDDKRSSRPGFERGEKRDRGFGKRAAGFSGRAPFDRDRPKGRSFDKERSRPEGGESRTSFDRRNEGSRPFSKRPTGRARPSFGDRPKEFRPAGEGRPQRTGSFGGKNQRSERPSRDNRGERKGGFGGPRGPRGESRFGEKRGFDRKGSFGRPPYKPKRVEEERGSEEPRNQGRSDDFVKEVARRYAKNLGPRKPRSGGGRPQKPPGRKRP